jgi:two-component system cell cycle sensor histidine kinase/response regulator CckA
VAGKDWLTQSCIVALMNAAQIPSGMTFGVAAGAWRWAALVFAALAIGCACLAVIAPNAAGWTGYALGGIGAVTSLLLYAVWPRQAGAVADARRVAEAASAANVAWAITGSDGAVLDCNPVYRRMSGARDGESAPPPELALAGEPSSAVLYRLSRDAADGKAREETFTVLPGLEIVAAVRPLQDKQTAWWFTPRLAASTSPQPVLTPKVVEPAAPVAAAPVQPAPHPPTDFAGLFRDAPMGVALADATGILTEANAAFAQFFGITDSLTNRDCADLVDASDKAAVRSLIAKAAQGMAGKQAIELSAERTAELFASPLNNETGPGGAVR